MSEIDTSAEAVVRHLSDRGEGISAAIASPHYDDGAGVSTRTGWHRRNDALMRALAAERDALQTARDGRVNSVAQNLDAQLRAVLAERDAAQDEARRLRLLCAQLVSAAGGSITLKPRDLVERDWVWSCEEDLNHGGFIYHAALAQKEAGHE